MPDPNMPAPNMPNDAGFVVTVAFEVDPAAAEVFLARVRQQASDSLSREPECYRFDVCTDPAIPGRFLLYEIYGSAEAFQTHLESAHFKAFDADIASIVRAKTVQTWQLHA